MTPPANLKLSPALLIPAEINGLPRMWVLYERLDGGEVCHARYIGILQERPGEDMAELQARAEERLRAGG